MDNPHFLAIPYPILGHMSPMMQFSQVLAIKYGCKITLLTTDDNYNKMKTTTTSSTSSMESQIRLVSFPDGLGPEINRSDITKVMLTIINTMRSMLPKLIEEINSLDRDNKISCILVTKNMGWALQVGHLLGIKGALFWPASATSLASYNSMQKLVDDGVIDSQSGHPKKNNEIQLSPNLPIMQAAAMPWYNLKNAFFFHHMMKEMKNMNLGEWWLCNTTKELEVEALSLSPKFLPIGPLMENENNMNWLWQEDKTCLDWLNQQPPKSVIYISFGSMVSTEPNQFKELALALDLLHKPFLWVVREDNNGKGVNIEYPNEFKGSQGKIVSWAPQKKILSHPSIACFITHCGWNSTIEGLCNGVPFLCLPFFSDQCMNKTYVCGVWKVGLGFDKDENGLVTRGEIKKKVELLMGDQEIKERSLKLMEIVVKNKAEGDKNLNKFVNWARE